MNIQAGNMHFQTLNEQIRETGDHDIVIEDCRGQRYIGSGQSDKTITIYGTPGNALGAYLNGGAITVYGNAQEATGDTMNAGEIVIHGSSGDATGYAMRGGRILVEGDVGYRAGIHMKAYREKIPVLVIGGEAGSFLGEYQAGGRIVLLRTQSGDRPFSCNFCSTGMHGGKLYIRADAEPQRLPKQIDVRRATAEDMEEVKGDVEAFCAAFGRDAASILSQSFYVLTPDTQNPYRQMYTPN